MTLAINSGSVAAPTTRSPIRPTLPHQDPNPTLRKTSLAQKRTQYKYEYTPIFVQQAGLDAKLAVCEDVPPRDEFSASYMKGRYIASLPLAPNNAMVSAGVQYDPLDEISDYEDFFVRIRKPALADTYRNDDSFAEQRLSGCNPFRLALLKPDDKRAKLLEPLNVQKQLKAGDIYVADYTGEDPTYTSPALVKGGGTVKEGDKTLHKYLPKPVAFFVWDGKRLMPLAIEIVRGGRIYTPAEKSSNDWFFAKICVQIADSHHHELSSHLARTHFTFEPVGVSTQRHLHESHPLSLLLHVHLRFHLVNNELAHTTLVAPSGQIATLLPGTHAESLTVVVNEVDTWHFKNFMFPNDIKARGLDDTHRLPHFPYRDDGILLWNATRKYVEKYIEHFYSSDAAVASDVELAAWAAELADQENGGRVKGFPSKITSVSELVDVATHIIFTCGPVHCSVNYSQYDYEALVSNMPFAAYLDVEQLAKQKEPITDKQIMELLPPFGQASGQVDATFLLTAFQFDEFGKYDKSYTELYETTFGEVFKDDKKVLKFHEAFVEDLARIEEKIKRRNAKRAVPYNSLLPSRVLNSISI